MHTDLDMRSPTAADVPGILEVMLAHDAVVVGHPDSDEEDVTWRWRLDGFDTTKDAIVIDVGGSIVSYAMVFEGTADIWVHPRVYGSGIGAILRRAVEDRACDRGDSPDGFIRQNITDRNRRAEDLLLGSGYEQSHHYARMEIELESAPVVPAPPGGVEIRGIRVGEDEHLVHEAHMAAWDQYRPSFRPESFERWSTNYLEGPDFDAGLWSVAVENGRVLSFTVCLDYPGMSWLQLLGTIPEARGRGLGELMLRNAFATNWARGTKKIGLTVSSRNLPQAKRLYERAGMTEVLRYINYRKPLAAPRH